MDVARDIVDRQLVDRDGRECGRVDDLWIEWDTGSARLGPLASGAAIVLDQLGAAGRLLQHVGGRRARRSHSIGWASIIRVERSRVLVTDEPADMSRDQSPSPGRRRYSAIARLAVIDSAGERRSVLDLRSEAAVGGRAPSILWADRLPAYLAADARHEALRRRRRATR
jgi:sporulation protein YlmC with PRC-barrel domain